MADFSRIKENTLRAFSDPIAHDNSPKMSIDYPCREILHVLNSHSSYYSLSSCSGRIAVFDSAAVLDGETSRDPLSDPSSTPNDPSLSMDATFGKGHGRWLVTEHRQVTFEEVRLAIYGSCSSSSPSSPPLSSSTSSIMLKHEPLLLHVSADNMDSANRLLKAALAAGFRESGIVPSSKTPHPTVAVRGMGLALSTPFYRGLGMEDYLRRWVDDANLRFRANEERSARLLREIEKVCFRRSPSNPDEEAGPQTATWSKLPDLNLRCHASVTHEDPATGDVAVLVFGGYGPGPASSAQPRVSGDVHALYRRRGVWEREWTTLDVANSQLFKPTRNLSCCVIPPSDPSSSPTVALFGGRSSPSDPNNNLLLYDIEKMIFKEANYHDLTSSPPLVPSPRYSHTMTPLSGRNGLVAVVVGGRDNDGSFADAYILRRSLDPSHGDASFSWKRFELPIGGVFNHAACPMPSAGDVAECVFISGGLESIDDLLSHGLKGGLIRISSNGDDLKWAPPPDLPLFSRTFSSTLDALGASSGGDGAVNSSRFVVRVGGVEACKNPDSDVLSLCYIHSPSRITSIPLKHLHPSLPSIDVSGLVDHATAVVEKGESLQVLLLGGGVGAFAFKGISSPSYLVTLSTEGGAQVVDEVPSEPSALAPPTTGRNGNEPSKSCPPCVLVHPKNVKKVKNQLEAMGALNKDFRINTSTTKPGAMAVPVHEVDKLQPMLDGEEEWVSLVLGISKEETPPLSKLLISNSTKDTMSNEDRKLSPPQRAVLEFFEGSQVGRKWIKDKVACPKGLEKLGVDLLVVPKDAYPEAFFDGSKPAEVFWEILSKHTKSTRIMKYGAIAPDSPTRQSGHRILYPPLPNSDTGVPETTGEGSPGWVCVKEFGVKQWFDCTRVMFCRGNNSEKKRFAALVKPDEKILDLYAGIGYYTLPALLAHPSTFVYCNEWNPDAVYALKYNLKANGVDDRAIVKEGDSRSVDYRGLVDRVSLGLLPSSEGCWGIAVRALKEEGGWVHVHGNVPTSEQDMFGRWVAHRMLQFREGWGAWCKHTEKVKSFAPKVDHLVADIYLGPEGAVEGVNVVPGRIFVSGDGAGDVFDATMPMEDLSCALKDGFALGNQKWMFPLDEKKGEGGRDREKKRRVSFRANVDSVTFFDPNTKPAEAEGGDHVEEEGEEEEEDNFMMMGGMFDGGYDDEFEEIPEDSTGQWGAEEENPNDDSDYPPNYLISAVLAGLYELPPLWLLKTQTGFGRRVKYKNPIARRLNDVRGIGWKEVVDCDIGGGMTIGLKEMVLPRYEKVADGVEKLLFQVFKIDFGSIMKDFNADLVDVARESEIEDTVGISVSNAGGSWHSRPEFFNKWKGRKSVDVLWEAVAGTLNFVEHKVSVDCGVEGGGRKLAINREDTEAWINISKAGSWNRLHTHAGAAWSAVYYVERGKLKDGKAYSGRLVLKPTPHEREKEWDMTKEERERFLGGGGGMVGEEGEEVLERADFWDEEAENCHLVVFPSWLHHAVLPYLEDGGEGEGGIVKERISVAINVS